MNITLTLPALHARQAAIRNSAARFNAICAGRRFGKNVLLHDLVAQCVLGGGSVGWLSPTYKNMTDDWDSIKDKLGPIISAKQEDAMRIDTVTGGYLEMWSGNNPEPIRGRAYDLFLFNEAAYIPDLLAVWNKIVRATLIDRAGKAWFCSTPNGINDFHTIYYTKDPEWARHHATSFDNPHIDPAEIEASKATMSEAEYRQEVLAEFIQDAGAVFRNLDAACTAPITGPMAHRGHYLVGGLDWGKDNDFTAISIGCVTCNREVALDRFNEIDYHFQTQRVVAAHKAWNVRQWKGEANSIGTVILERLQRQKLPIVPWTATNVSKQAVIEALSLALETADVTLLPDEYGKSELQAYQSHKTPTGLRSYGAPSGMHDDTIMARAIMYQAMQDHRGKARQEQSNAATTQSSTQTSKILGKVF